MKHVIDGIELPAFPWAWHQQGDANDHVLLTSEKNWVIAFRTNGEFMPAKEAAIIRHLVASANACAGIPIQDLDRVKDATAPVFEILMETRKQRDELLAALSELTSTVGLAIDGATGWDAHKNARKLIASVKGGET